ncbi:hypothetical protein PAN31108_04272 [Pandoraea anhela]|uniref:Glycine zipper family protein n=1 Tax=Pandoraea anhela TaxID=2508295 RepID=A0A5E4Y4G2_9BURK|nr:hypothetical protein PAN31108_04272 [Pandoraea anhela]
MAMIVAGRFTTFDQATRVANRLYDRSFRPSDVSVFFLNPTGQHATFPIGGDVDADAAARPAGRGAAQGVIAGGAFGLALGALLFFTVWRFWLVPVVGMMAGAYLGAFLGALGRMRGRERVSARAAGMRDAGVMLATHVSETTADTAIAVLREAGAAEIERANGVWEGGEWRDFDPVQRAPGVQGEAVDVTPAEPTVGVAANDRRTPSRREAEDAMRKSPRRTDWL